MQQDHQSTLLATAQPMVSRKALTFIFIAVFFDLLGVEFDSSDSILR